MGAISELARVDWHVPPAKQLQALRLECAFNHLFTTLAREEEHANSDEIRVIQSTEAETFHFAFQQPPGYLRQHTGSVATLAIGSDGAAVAQVGNCFDSLGDNIVRRLAAEAGNETHAARVMFE